MPEVPVKTPVQMNEEKACVLESSQKPAAPKAAPKLSYSSQCHEHTGLIGIDLQKKGKRAMCPRCGAKFEVDDVRFAHAYDVLKFNKYIHASCYLAYAKVTETADFQQIHCFLESYITSPTSSTSSVDAKCLQSAQQVQSELHSLMHGSQSSRLPG